MKLALAAQLLAHERRDQAAEVAAAARAADDDVGHDAVFVQRGLRLHADDALVQKHLIEHAAQHVPVAGRRGRFFHGLADGASERARRAGVLGEDLAADLRLHGRRRRDGRAVRAHNLAAEGLLLIGTFHHVDLAVEPQVRARHRQRRAPLARARLGRHAGEPLLPGVIRLRDGAVQLVAAGGVVALELVVDLRGRAEFFLKAVRAHQRRGAVHLVEIADLVGNGDLARVVVQLLTDQLVAEHRAQIVEAHRRARGGVQQRGGLLLHVGAHIVPRARQFLFGQIDFVRDFFSGHGKRSFLSGLLREKKKALVPQRTQMM